MQCKSNHLNERPEMSRIRGERGKANVSRWGFRVGNHVPPHRETRREAQRPRVFEIVFIVAVPLHCPSLSPGVLDLIWGYRRTIIYATISLPSISTICPSCHFAAGIRASPPCFSILRRLTRSPCAVFDAIFETWVWSDMTVDGSHSAPGAFRH